MNVRVILAKGPCWSPLSACSFSLCAAEESPVHLKRWNPKASPLWKISPPSREGCRAGLGWLCIALIGIATTLHWWGNWSPPSAWICAGLRSLAAISALDIGRMCQSYSTEGGGSAFLTKCLSLWLPFGAEDRRHPINVCCVELNKPEPRGGNLIALYSKSFIDETDVSPTACVTAVNLSGGSRNNRGSRSFGFSLTMSCQDTPPLLFPP